MSAGLVVNADDLGRTIGINEGIFTAHRHGLVSSATLMVGFPAARDAARALADHPALGVGLHVTLTGAEPTLPAAAVPSLVDGAGRLARKPELIDAPDPDELLAEIRHQLEIFVSLVGRLPTHLDSHHHSHRHPAVLDALTLVAREHRLPLRRSSEAIAARLAGEGLATTDRFVERFFDSAATLPVLHEILRDAAAAGGTTEVMCHPGHPDDALRRESGYAEAREREIAVLCDPSARALADELALRRLRFDQACGS